MQTYDIKSLQHFEKKIYQYVNISLRNFKEQLFWQTSANGCFLRRVHETDKNQHLFLRSFNFSLKKQAFSISISEIIENVLLIHGWFTIKFTFTNNISLVWWEINFRSNHSRCSVKKGVLKNFSKSTGKHLCQSLFNKVAGLRSATLLKRRLWHRCFPVNFAKFLRTPFCTDHLWTIASETSEMLMS